jgi:TusA-related sulfurtransferase
MADQTVDARGLSCPEPVLLSKQAIDGISSGTIDVLVDTVTSRENVARMARKLSCTVETRDGERGGFILHIKKG